MGSGSFFCKLTKGNQSQLCVALIRSFCPANLRLLSGLRTCYYIKAHTPPRQFCASRLRFSSFSAAVN